MFSVSGKCHKKKNPQVKCKYIKCVLVQVFDKTLLYSTKFQIHPSVVASLIKETTTSRVLPFKSKSLCLFRDEMKGSFVITQTRQNFMLMGVISQFALLFQNTIHGFSMQREKENWAVEERTSKTWIQRLTQHCSTSSPNSTERIWNLR